MFKGISATTTKQLTEGQGYSIESEVENCEGYDSPFYSQQSLNSAHTHTHTPTPTLTPTPEMLSTAAVL